MRIPSRLYRTSDVQTRTDKVGEGQQARGSAAEEAVETPKASKGDVRVEISNRARRMSNVHQLDMAKVERLRLQIDSGGLNIDVDRIANRIVETGG